MVRNYKFDWYCDNVIEVNDEYQNEKISGYTGHWNALEKIELGEFTYYLFEHDFYGDATCYLVGQFDNYGNLMEVFETYDSLIQCLVDEEIIDC